MTKEENNFSIYDELLKQVNEIKFEKIERNFFNISGDSYYENRISNILAFYFNDMEEHELNNLWLKSLLICYNNNKNCLDKIDYNNEHVEKVEREYYTNDKKRIDIVIELNKYVIIIENKIYADLTNDLGGYSKQIENDFSKRKIIKIVLSVNDESELSIENSYINIRYKDLIKQLEKNLENSEEPNNKWWVLMNELILNIKNICGENNMNQDWQEYLKNNATNIAKFQKCYNDDLKIKQNYLKEKILELLKEQLESKGFKKDKSSSDEKIFNYYNSTDYSGHFSIFVNLPEIKGDILCVESYVDKLCPDKLVIALWNRTNNNDWFSTIDFKDKKRLTVNDGDRKDWGTYVVLEELNFGDEHTREPYAVVKKIVNICENVKDRL